MTIEPSNIAKTLRHGRPPGRGVNAWLQHDCCDRAALFISRTAAALLAAGMSIREIAEETGLSADVELAADPGSQVGNTVQVLLRNLERGVGIHPQPLGRKRELRLLNRRGDQSIRDDRNVHAFRQSVPQ
jgi:hypothetical protein